MVTCQPSELGWEVTVELPADFLSLGRGSVTIDNGVLIKNIHYNYNSLEETNSKNYLNFIDSRP